MYKLNNKGITTIEVILCFVLIVIITISMYTTISSFNDKRMIEEYKSQVYTYKNGLTKTIQDDLIRVGLAAVFQEYEKDGAKEKYIITFTLKDGNKRLLIIEKQYALSEYHTSGSDSVDDYFMISYGKLNDVVEYPLPDLGGYTNDYNHSVKDLSINNILINISDSNVLTIYIGFYHPELSTRYAIDIVCPINYIQTESDNTKKFNLY